jgi:ribose/xylose/arabinose/galactoside ABC-type transport system permease subunit
LENPAKEISMTQKFLWRGVLIAALSVALATPARANQLQTDATEIVIGIVVVTAVIAVGVTVLILHHHHKLKSGTITGCVDSGANGMSVANEKDKRNYALSGNTVGVKQGDRMTLEGKRKDNGKTLVFEVQKVTTDFGACQP